MNQTLNSLEKETYGCETWQSHPSLLALVGINRCFIYLYIMAWQRGNEGFGQKPGSVGNDKTICGRNPLKIAMEYHGVLLAFCS